MKIDSGVNRENVVFTKKKKIIETILMDFFQNRIVLTTKPRWAENRQMGLT